MKIGINKKYLVACIVLFVVEAIIAVFVRDDFIRPYLGDVLVVVLIYCFIKSFVRNEIQLLPLYIFIFAALVEIGQYFSAAELLGLGDNRIARIIIGSAFDLKDIACYLTGCAMLFLFERLMRKGCQRSGVMLGIGEIYMLPIPTHLENILIPMGDKNNELHVNGLVHCSCGCESFHIKIYANTEKGYPQVCEYSGDYALVVKTVCMDCEKEHLIFDGSIHGWNGFVCHDGVTVPDEKLKSWNCPKCSRDIHNIKISINSQGKQDFIDETGIVDGETDFAEDDWINAFDWITIGLHCMSCGYSDKKWIDYETM